MEPVYTENTNNTVGTHDKSNRCNNYVHTNKMLNAGYLSILYKVCMYMYDVSLLHRVLPGIHDSGEETDSEWTPHTCTYTPCIVCNEISCI